MKKALALAFVVATATSLSACGFALRGSDRTAAVIAPTNLSTQLILEDNQFALGLKRPLVKRLQLLGVSEQATAANIVKVDNLRLRRYELVGTLTEVRLVMMADVSYTISGQTHRAPVQVEQSYQYNEVSVVTIDQQGEKTKTWLYDHLAQRIAEQYYAKAKL
ncbi:hypothetical protein [Moraxella ovis]|uniref:hypothetical protein n=1 Tax=Moraxella ovis TaxID=29433 RepID=UPI000D9E6A36|nr:hypothetical protein [Moraxella ovis]SPX84960.1 Uncharacterised protein [Moraxella ovis]STZ05341.1 Uncharacterised protein [Moraxella ovis]